MSEQASIGRIVHFHPAATGERPAGYQPNAAIVTRVNENGTVNLYVFHSGRGASASGSAAEIPHGDPADPKFKSGRFWSWPPRESAIEEGATAFVGDPAVDESAGGDADPDEPAVETSAPAGDAGETARSAGEIANAAGDAASVEPVRQTSEN